MCKWIIVMLMFGSGCVLPAIVSADIPPPPEPPKEFVGHNATVKFLLTPNQSKNTDSVTGRLISLNDQGYLHLRQKGAGKADVLIPTGLILRIDRVADQ